jgi:hypothetical protein
LTDKSEPKKEDSGKMAEAPKPAPQQPKKEESKPAAKEETKKEVEEKAKGSRNETRVSFAFG